MATKPRKKAPKAPKSANPIGDFLKDETKKRQLPVVQEKKARAGNPNKAKPPKVINQGHTPGSSSRAVVPYEAPAKKSSSVLRTLGKVAKVASGPVGLAVGMIADSKPAGAGSDKPSGPLMKGNATKKAKRNPTPKNPNEGVGPKAKAKKKDPTPSNPNRGLGDSRKAAEAPKPKAKPQAAPKAKKAASDAPKPKLKPSKAAAGQKAKKPSFSGNWKGAAPTAMQARGGAKKTGNGGLLGAIRRKLGK